MGSLESDRAPTLVGKHGDGKSWNEGFVQTTWAGEPMPPERRDRTNDQRKPEPFGPPTEADQATVNGIARNARDLAKTSDAYWGVQSNGQIDFSAAKGMETARESLRQQINCMGTDELNRVLPAINRELEKDGMSLRFYDDDGTNDVDVIWKQSSGQDSTYNLGGFHRKSPNPGCFVS
jgi:hypothetical protein